MSNPTGVWLLCSACPWDPPCTPEKGNPSILPPLESLPLTQLLPLVQHLSLPHCSQTHPRLSRHPHTVFQASMGGKPACRLSAVMSCQVSGNGSNGEPVAFAEEFANTIQAGSPLRVELLQSAPPLDAHPCPRQGLSRPLRAPPAAQAAEAPAVHSGASCPELLVLATPLLSLGHFWEKRKAGGETEAWTRRVPYPRSNIELPMEQGRQSSHLSATKWPRYNLLSRSHK